MRYVLGEARLESLIRVVVVTRSVGHVGGRKRNEVSFREHTSLQHAHQRVLPTMLASDVLHAVPINGNRHSEKPNLFAQRMPFPIKGCFNPARNVLVAHVEIRFIVVPKFSSLHARQSKEMFPGPVFEAYLSLV